MEHEQGIQESKYMNEAEWECMFGAAITVNAQATDTAGLVFS